MANAAAAVVVVVFVACLAAVGGSFLSGYLDGIGD
jgi:hypothetical protein